MANEENIKDSTTEQKILETAERLFLEKGFALVSTVEIAREAGCNQALVHYYFRSKELLFQRIFTEKIRNFAVSFFEIDKEGGTFEEKLRRKIEAHFELLLNNPRIPFLIINEVTTNPKRIESIKEGLRELPFALHQNIQGMLEEEAKKGTIRKISAYDFLLTVLSLNIAPFLFYPMAKTITGFSDVGMLMLLQNRKEENVRIILNSLRP